MDLYFATSNKNKLREARHVLGKGLKAKALDIKEIQSVSVQEVVSHKAMEAYSMLKKPLIVEDTGLFIKALNGFPGALAKHMSNAIGYDGFMKLLNGYTRDVYAETCIAYYDGKKMRLFTGRAEGRIARKKSDGEGWGFDCVFIPKGYSKTFAQLGPEVKLKISHRGKAFAKLKKYLEIKHGP